MGMVTEAVQDFEAALSQRSQGWNAYLPGVLAGLVECRIARGELDLAAEHRAELESVAHRAGMTGAYATWALADLAEANGEPRPGRHAVRRGRAPGVPAAWTTRRSCRGGPARRSR